MVVIEEDMKKGTKREVTFLETWRQLIVTNGLTKIALNYLLLSNTKVMNERFAYRRKLTG